MSNAALTTLSLLSSLPFFVVGVLGFLRESHIKSSWVETQGIIVELRHGGGTTAPVVEYVANSEIFRVKSIFSSSMHLNSFYIEQAVVICYNPKKPKKFRIKHDKTPVFLWTIFTFLGLCGLCLSAVLFFVL